MVLSNIKVVRAMRVVKASFLQRIRQWSNSLLHTHLHVLSMAVDVAQLKWESLDAPDYPDSIPINGKYYNKYVLLTVDRGY